MTATLTLQNRDTSRLSQSVYETLLEAIISGKLAPGDVISEVELSRQLDVSRTPVHEAIRMLSKDGLVKQEANRRPVISRFSPEDVRDIFEMRVLLEGEATFRAATRIDRPTLAKLQETAQNLAQTRTDEDWINRWADFDSDFHDAIANASGSRRLHEDIGRYRLLHHCLNTLRTNNDILGQALQEHVDILDALNRRDAEEAKRRMVAHIQEWQNFFVQSMS